MRERLGSQAFSLEYQPVTTDLELYDDVVSYLGEYRLKLDKFRYNFDFSGDSKAAMCLRDIRRGESMRVKILRAIDEKKKNGLPTEREEAELCGISSLDDQLRFVQEEGTLLWASPPGPREQGYGDYGFLFLGKVRRTQELQANVSMVAIRIENPLIERFNSALSILLGKEVSFESASDFLRSPWVVNTQIGEEKVNSILGKVFSPENGEVRERQFDQIKQNLDPLINDFIRVVKCGSKEEKLKAFYTLENYTLALKERYGNDKEGAVFLDSYYGQRRLRDLIHLYGHKPPLAAGSCGPSGETSSNNPLNKFDSLSKTLFGEEWFACPKCSYQADGPVGNKCPGCGLTKEEYAEDSGEPVCE